MVYNEYIKERRDGRCSITRRPQNSSEWKILLTLGGESSTRHSIDSSAIRRGFSGILFPLRKWRNFPLFCSAIGWYTGVPNRTNSCTYWTNVSPTKRRTSPDRSSPASAVSFPPMGTFPSSGTSWMKSDDCFVKKVGGKPSHFSLVGQIFTLKYG